MTRHTSKTCFSKRFKNSIYINSVERCKFRDQKPVMSIKPQAALSLDPYGIDIGYVGA